MSGLKMMGLFFVGIAIGSQNPYRTIWGVLIPIIIATIFIGLDLYFELKEKIK